MAQNTQIVLKKVSYNRADYTALRAWSMKIPLQRIADLYYSEDSPQIEGGLEKFLLKMRDDLVERAIEHNPMFAESLKNARQSQLSPKALDILIQAADLPEPVPGPKQPISQWFRPRTVRSLRGEGIHTLGDLVDLINRRGPGWWRSIPRIGTGRAGAITAWLEARADKLGAIKLEARRPLAVVEYHKRPILDPAAPNAIAPLGTFTLPSALDGREGVNRVPQFCFIEARHDLQAVEFYLSRYEGQPHTLRAYRKELERFVLWCALVARKPLSSLLVDDCETYKAFLRAPSPAFCGPRASRSSQRWRPFTDEPLSPASQKQAVLIIRAAFDYFVKVRYLAGNPWVVVKDPVVDEEVDPIQVDRALSEAAWTACIKVLQQRSEVEGNVRDRVALASILLMGDSGLRRHEAAGAKRSDLKPSRNAAGVWMLKVLGKRRKKRQVPVSPRAVRALRAHWQDRGLAFDNPADDRPLLAPLVIPRTPAAIAKHDTEAGPKGYTANAIYDVVVGALRRVREHLSAIGDGETQLAVSDEDLAQLLTTSPHALRHTFGTLAVEKDMQIVVVQEILGHASSSTTAIYARAREKRIAEAAANFYGDAGVGGT